MVVPVKNESSSDSNSRSSLGRSTGYSTPATSVSAAVTEPGTKIATKTSARINAADRVKELQSTALSLASHQRGRKRSAAVLAEDDGDASDVPLAHAFKKRTAKRPTGADLEASDSALAHALQMDEYEYPLSTTEQRLPVDKFIDEHASDSGSRPVSPLSSEPPELLHSDTSEDPLEGRSPSPLGEGLLDDIHDSEADLPPTWEEHRKARRVSRVLPHTYFYMTDHHLGGKRPKEPCE